MAKVTQLTKTSNSKSKNNSAAELIQEFESNELVFAVVGAVGAGSSLVAATLNAELEKKGYDVTILKASDEIRKWAENTGYSIDESDAFKAVEAFQTAGDTMREEDDSAVALKLIEKIRDSRAEKTGNPVEAHNDVIRPDGEKRAYILDSLKHPSEVALLRLVYKEAFCLIGVYCNHEERKKRLGQGKFKEASQLDIEAFMERDKSDPSKNSHGQQVVKTFHLSDFFCDNSCPNTSNGKQSHPDWDIPEQLGRLLDAITHSKVIRPTPDETGMYHAFSAKFESACLSRQVGAALMDRDGNVLATGTNEVPKAGGGTYTTGQSGLFIDPSSDSRCFLHGQCRNTTTQYDIIDKIIKDIENYSTNVKKVELRERLKNSAIGQLIEFSRAVHAEMDSLLSAARQGSSIVGSKMYVTTFPCHNCARHIVAAGVDEVQFIEPYLKSRAIELHGDSITMTERGWIAPSLMTAGDQEELKKLDGGADIAPKVLFKPFRGVAPNLYKYVFLKDRALKDEKSGKLEIGSSDRSLRSAVLAKAYCEIEAKLIEAKNG